MTIKVLYIESGVTGGGSFVSLYHHMNVIDRSHLHPVVCFLNQNNFVRRLRRLGIKVYVVRDLLYSKKTSDLLRKFSYGVQELSRRMFRFSQLPVLRILHTPAVRALDRIVKIENIDLIHLNNSVNRDIFGIFLAEKTGLPCVCHLRSMQGIGLSPQSLAFAAGICQRFVANSLATKHFWEAKGLPGEKINVVYNGLPIHPCPTKQRRSPSSWAKVACVANFLEIKGHSFLLSSFARLRRKGIKAKLHLFGTGNLRTYLEKFSNDLEINDDVVFEGYVNDMQSRYREFDLIAVPSKGETFGRVIIEAFLARVPVVATNVGGIPEIIENGRSGILVNYGDELAMVKAIESILRDPELAREMAETGRRVVFDKFSIDNYAVNLKDIYNGIMSLK